MPKYFMYKVYGYYLYFTSHCTVEAMHAHASDKALNRYTAAKFFIKSNGDTEVSKRGSLSDQDINKIRAYIKIHFKKMFELWTEYSDKGYYGEE